MVPAAAFVTTLFVPTSTGGGEGAIQFEATGSVLDWRRNIGPFVGQSSRTWALGKLSIRNDGVPCSSVKLWSRPKDTLKLEMIRAGG
jgi:hypothetical protein